MTPNPAEIRTERLLLRRVGPGDLGAATAILTDPHTHHFNPAGPPTPDEVAGLLADWQTDWERDGIGYWAVLPAGADEVIGFGGLRHHRLDGEPTLNLFYRFGPAHWGRGYAPEMARAAVDWADRVRPVVIITDLDNTPSQRVAEKLGFAHVGDSITVDGPVLVYRRREAALAT
ncbi:GNAT family N-acetyltransferase [Actinosynnema sp. NPDC050436]|uniref:GNAT family N-acetyltransferase n=1 Tax=Actinosynnema sp. NPDC050436 TaxID=3155659 RepID=UPI00340C2BA7